MIVIPMAGRSSRFFKAGYKVPKYQLPITDTLCVFECILLCFKKYFSSETFLIICLRNDKNFIEEKIENIGIKKSILFCLDQVTRGQAETVYIGIKNSNIQYDQPMLVFNIDTFRPSYRFPGFINDCDGYLEVFRGEGDHWSFARIDHKGFVLKTTEKRRISDLCSTGAYFFHETKSFLYAFEKCLSESATVNGEYYIAPLYNCLINEGMRIKANIVEREEVMFCGVPAEYEALDKELLLTKLDIIS